ncbi:MAG: SUMF1/EgtB/PvdO family nonheme iron enzyme [Planctomycetes bacterium]|nr:SUMF1/EgtB/PvdO family nonheme iron enzyme [Planctomycetota bacterium]
MHAAVLAAVLSAGACDCLATATRASGAPEPRRVVLDNRTGANLRLCRAVRDGWGAETGLGDGATITLDLLPGRYAVAIGDGAPSLPLPLPVAELGFTPPATLSLTMWPAPAPEPGWCWIPPGITLRGDDLGIGQEDERPVSTPALPGFWLAERETTNAQFAAFLNALRPDAVADAWLDLAGHKCRVHRDAAHGGFTTNAPELPVVTVSWEGAAAYCRWRTQSTGVVHRLPTETEWEKAARGPGSRVYAYGDTYRTAAANQESGNLLPTGRFPANGFGLLDMTGNAFEWTGDVFVRAAYGGRHPAGEGEDGYRALRGGSFVLDGIFVRNSMRMRLRPEVRADDVGFRVLRQNTDPAVGPVPAARP